MSEGNCLQHLVWTCPSLLFTLSHVNILVQFENSLLLLLFFSFNVLYTFVLLIDMIAFLVFNSVGGAGIECHQCRCMYTQ